MNAALGTENREGMLKKKYELFYFFLGEIWAMAWKNGLDHTEASQNR